MRADQAKYLRGLALLMQRMFETGQSLGPDSCDVISKELTKALEASGDDGLQELEDWYERVGKG